MEYLTREEQYLGRLSGDDEAPISNEPISRKERYLYRLCGGDVAIPSNPINREEMYLAHLCGEDVDIPTPVTRLEMFMAFATGEHDVKPTPITRQEILWDEYKGGDVPEEKTVDWTPVISVSDALAKPAVDLQCKITAVQEGSGNPSPTNIRPITGFTGLTLHVNSSEIPITWQTEAGTVYGGILDVTTGALSVNADKITLDGTETITGLLHTNGGWAFTVRKSQNVYTGDVILSTINEGGKNYSQITTSGFCRITITGQYPIFMLKDSDSGLDETATAEQVATAYTTFIHSLSDVSAVYPLLEPLPYTLTPTEIKLLAGANTLWADTGDSKLTYLAKAAEIVRKMNANLQKNLDALKLGGKIEIKKPAKEVKL